MPVMSGKDVCRQLRSRGFKELPIIAVTGAVRQSLLHSCFLPTFVLTFLQPPLDCFRVAQERNDKSELLDCGFNYVVPKPCTAGILQSALGLVLGPRWSPHAGLQSAGATEGSSSQPITMPDARVSLPKPAEAGMLTIFCIAP